MQREFIIESNRLIAEFMDVEIGDYTSAPDEFCTQYHIDDIEYHCSWDWLMRVFEKINSFQDENDDFLFTAQIRPDYFVVYEHETVTEIVYNEDGVSLIEMVYMGVVKFVKWYNQQ